MVGFRCPTHGLRFVGLGLAPDLSLHKHVHFKSWLGIGAQILFKTCQAWSSLNISPHSFINFKSWLGLGLGRVVGFESWLGWTYQFWSLNLDMDQTWNPKLTNIVSHIVHTYLIFLIIILFHLQHTHNMYLNQPLSFSKVGKLIMECNVVAMVSMLIVNTFIFYKCNHLRNQTKFSSK